MHIIHTAYKNVSKCITGVRVHIYSLVSSDLFTWVRIDLLIYRSIHLPVCLLVCLSLSILMTACCACEGRNVDCTHQLLVQVQGPAAGK